MRRLWLFVWLLLGLIPACEAQYSAANGSCILGGTKANVSGMTSSNYLEGIVPACTVSVFLTGTATPATIYSTATGTPLSSVFTANGLASVNPGGWLFFAAPSACYDIVLSGGSAPNNYPAPVPLTDVCVGGGSSGGSGTVTNFSANDVTNLLAASVATSTTTPVLSYALKSAQSGMVPNSTSSTVGGWTYTPFLGALGGTNGSITFAAGTNGVTVKGLSAGSPSTVSLTGAGLETSYLGADGGYHPLPIPTPSCPTTTFTTTPVYNFASANCTSITLTANITSATSSGFSAGELYQVVLIENGTGNFTAVPPINFKGGPSTINLAANGKTVCNYLAFSDGNLYLQGCTWF